MTKSRNKKYTESSYSIITRCALQYPEMIIVLKTLAIKRESCIFALI